MAKLQETDPIGFDPVAWVERLMDVNEGSQFQIAQRDHIGRVLTALRTQLVVMEGTNGHQK